MTQLTLYSKPGCHLCDDMKTIVARVARDFAGTTLEEIDISTNAGLLAQYELEVPVLLVNGRKVAKYRIGEADFRRILDPSKEKG